MDPDEWLKIFGFPMPEHYRPKAPTAVAPPLSITPTPTPLPASIPGPTTQPITGPTQTPGTSITSEEWIERFGFPMPEHYKPRLRGPAAPAAVPAAVPAAAPVVQPPIGQQGLLPIPGLEQLPGADLPHAGLGGNIPPEVGAAVPSGFFGALATPLKPAWSAIAEHWPTVDVGFQEASALGASFGPMGVAETGLTSSRSQSLREEAVIEGTVVGSWLDGAYGNANSTSAWKQMYSDLTKKREEMGFAGELAAGLSSPSALIPLPIIDPLFGLALRGLWKGIRISFKARGFIVDLFTGNKPRRTITNAQMEQHARGKEEIQKFHPRAQEGVEISKNPIQEAVDETEPGKYAFVRYTTDIINGEEAEVIRIYKNVDPLSTEYQMYRDLEQQGLGVLVRQGETVGPETVANYRARNEARQAAEEADVNVVPDQVVEPVAEVVSAPGVGAVPSPRELQDSVPTREYRIDSSTPVQEIIDQHGDFAVRVEDTSRNVAFMNASDYLKLLDNPEFRKGIKETIIATESWRLRDIPRANKPEEFMDGLFLTDILVPAPGVRIADDPAGIAAQIQVAQDTIQELSVRGDLSDILPETMALIGKSRQNRAKWRDFFFQKNNNNENIEPSTLIKFFPGAQPAPGKGYAARVIDWAERTFPGLFREGRPRSKSTVKYDVLDDKVSEWNSVLPVPARVGAEGKVGLDDVLDRIEAIYNRIEGADESRRLLSIEEEKLARLNEAKVAPIVEPAAPTETVPTGRPELAMSADEMKAALESSNGTTIVQAFRNSLSRYPQDVTFLPGSQYLDEWKANSRNLTSAMELPTAPGGSIVGRSALKNTITNNILVPVDEALGRRGVTLSEVLEEFDNLAAANGYTDLVRREARAVPSTYETIDLEDALVDWTGIEERVSTNYEGIPVQVFVADTRHVISNLETQYAELIPPEIPEEYTTWFDELEDLVGQSRFAIERATRLSGHITSAKLRTLEDLQGTLDDAINNVAEQLEILGYSVEEAIPVPGAVAATAGKNQFEQAFEALTRAKNYREAQEALKQVPEGFLPAMKETLDKFDDSPNLRRAKKAVDDALRDAAPTEAAPRSRVRIVEAQPHPAEPVIVPSEPSVPSLGTKRVYHGTSQIFDAFNAGAQSSNALYGPGAYFTENASVASRYAVTTATRKPMRNFAGEPIDHTGRVLDADELEVLEAGGAPNVWSVDLEVTRFLDIDASVDQELIDVIRRILDDTELASNERWLDNGLEFAKFDSIDDIKTNNDLYNVLLGTLGNKSEVNDWLIGNNYDAITHIGGRRTGTAPHRVWIGLGEGNTFQPTSAFGRGTREPLVLVVDELALDPASRTYDEWQKTIDNMEDSLEKGDWRTKGIDVNKLFFPEDAPTLMPAGWRVMPDALAELYRARNAVGAVEDAASLTSQLVKVTDTSLSGPAFPVQRSTIETFLKQGQEKRTFYVAMGYGEKITNDEWQRIASDLFEAVRKDAPSDMSGLRDITFIELLEEVRRPSGMWAQNIPERVVEQLKAIGSEIFDNPRLRAELPTEAAPDIPSQAAGIQPDMFGRANRAIYNTDADMSQASFNLTPDEQVSGLEQVADQVNSGEKDIFDALADASNINAGRTPGTDQPQFYLSTKANKETTSISAKGTNQYGLEYSYRKQVTRYRVVIDWPKSRKTGELEGADPTELRELEIPNIVAWIVEETADDAGIGPAIAFRLHTVGDDGLPGIEIASFKNLSQARNGLRWDTSNGWIGYFDDVGSFQVYGGGGGTAFPGAPGDYSGITGQIRLNNQINVDLMQLQTLKRLIVRLTEKGVTGGATRLRIRAGEIADRLDILVGRIVDQDFPGGNAMGLRRAIYQETSTIRSVSPEERSIFIARRDEPERMGMGLGVQEKVDFINGRLGDYRVTKQLLNDELAASEIQPGSKDREDLIYLIQGDAYDEAEELRALADNLPVEGTEASQALARGLRSEVYDEIGDIDPRWKIWDVAEGGGGPSGAGDPEIARALEEAAERGERTVYIPDEPHNMADSDHGAPKPPNMNKPVPDEPGFISIRNIRSLDAFYDEDVIVHDSAAVRHIYTWTPMRFVDDTVRKNTPSGRLMTAWMMAQVADDQWIDVTLQATFDAYAKKGRFGFSTGTMNLPINRETGFWGDSGLHWADVWSFWNGKHKGHIDKYADRLDGKLRHLIAEFSNVVNEEVEQLREMNGLPARRKKRGPGEVYIPRKVEGIRDLKTGKLIPFEKPTNPNHERMWEMATEAYQRHGVDYTNNPRSVLELHLRSALKEIRHRQMEEMMERLGLGVTISDLVNPAILAKKLDTAEALSAAERRLKEVAKEIFGEEIWSRMGAGISNIHIDLDLAADISRAQEAMRRAPDFAENLKRLNDEYEELAGKMVERTSAEGKTRMERVGGTIAKLKSERNTARNAYKKHVDRLKNAAYVEITGGKSGLFGGAVADGLYPITANRFKNKFFLTEDYNEISDFIKGMDPEQREGFGPAVIQGFQTVVNVSRFLASVGDFAMPFINLLPVLGESPRIWAKATLNHYKAWADPTVQSRLIRDNIQEYYDLAINGVPVGDPEFFAALAPGQGINLDNVMKKWEQKRPPANKAEKAIFKALREAQHIGRGAGRQTFGRFQTSYQTGLGHARMMLLKSIRSSWKGTDNELYSYIRNMTGGLDSRRSGIMPGQRAFEGMFLAFSPRLFRSTVALASDAMQTLPRMGAKRVGIGTGSTAQQRRALKSISQLIAGTYGIYYVTAKWGFGMEDDEIMDGMNPASGRRFLSVPINGDWVGVGGQIRALMQFSWAMMGIMTEGNLGEDDRKWSDLWSTNSMRNPFVYLYMSRGAPGTRAIGSVGESMLGVDMLPFDNPDGFVDLLTHYGEGSLPFAIQHGLESKTWETAAMEMFGARASFNPRDRATQYITNGEENVYTDQPQMVKWLVNELIETEQSEFDSIEMKRRKALLALQGTDFNYITWLGIEKYYSGARGWAAEQEDFGPPADVNDPDPNNRAIAQYYSLFRDPRVRDAEGISMPNGNDMFSNLLRIKANTSVSMGGFGWTPEQKQHVIANTNLRPVPWFILRKIGGTRADSIKQSQKMREQMFIDMGRRDLAMISHRLFYMLPPGQGAYSDVIDQMTEGAPPDFGNMGAEDLWEWQQERRTAPVGAR